MMLDNFGVDQNSAQILLVCATTKDYESRFQRQYNAKSNYQQTRAVPPRRSYG